VSEFTREDADVAETDEKEVVRLKRFIQIPLDKARADARKAEQAEAKQELERQVLQQYTSQDRDGLFKVLEHKIAQWVRAKVGDCGIRFDPNLLDDLGQVAAVRLWRAIPRMLKRNMNGGAHIVRSARVAVVREVGKALARETLIPIPSSTLEYRRKKLRNGTLRLPISIIRPRDMPERPLGSDDNQVYRPWECHKRVKFPGGTKRQASGRYEFEDRRYKDWGATGRRIQTAAGYREPMTAEYNGDDLCLAQHVAPLAYELSGGIVARVVELMVPTACWVGPTTWKASKDYSRCKGWQSATMGELARKFGLRDGNEVTQLLEELADTIVTNATSEMIELGESVDPDNWQRSRHKRLRSRAA
jgi:hypothetical protein